jgi:hypothetical protein
VPAVALVTVVAVVAVVAAVAVDLVAAAVLALTDEVAVVAVALEAALLEGTAVAARHPVRVTIAATLPAPTARRDRRAGCGLRFRSMEPIFGPVAQKLL